MNDQSFEQKWLEGANGKICYFSNQEFKDKPTVVFLHGLSSNHTTWNAMAVGLKKYRLNFLLPDLRGHGYSDKTKKRSLYKFSVFIEDLEKIIEKEKISRVILVGYSFGGFIALGYAIKYPVSVASLILISTNHVNPFRYRHINFLTWPTYYAVSFLAWLLLWQKRKQYYYYRHNPEVIKGYWPSTLSGFATMPISVNLWMLAEIAYLDFSHDIEKITCPTLIIKSKSDPFVSLAEAADMMRKIKSAEIITLETTTHFLASRCQEDITGIIINFLKKHHEDSDF